MRSWPKFRDGKTGRISMTAADDIGGFVAAACKQLPLSQDIIDGDVDNHAFPR